MKKMKFVILIIILFVLGVVLLNNNRTSFNTKVVSYNGNNLRISVDGKETGTLPTSGTYYLTNYDCKNTNTKLVWDNINYQLKISDGSKSGGVSCNLELKSKPLLSEMPVGSYVKYVGNNGCTGKSCEGYNANYESNINMGYCSDPNYKFYENGWRIAYKDNGSVYLISGGATDCLCASSDGILSASSCSGSSLYGTDLDKHFTDMDDFALKYCNNSYVKDGVCSLETIRAMKDSDLKKILGSIENINDCRYSHSNTSCGYNNDLIDIGGYYKFSTVGGDIASGHVLSWDPSNRYLFNSKSIDMYGVRPVISLDSSVVVTGGDGTYEFPYLISNNSFLINNGDKYVTSNNSSSVQLSLIGNDVVTMCISVDSSVCTNYIDFNESYTLNWSNVEDGEKIVYVTYKDSSGKVVATMNRSIILDTISPTNNSVTIGSESGLTRTLTVSSVDADYMCFSNTSSNVNNCTEWVDYATSYSWTLSEGEGTKTVYAFFKDKAGNVSNVVSDTITYSLPCLGDGEIYTLGYSGSSVSSSTLDFKFCSGRYKLEVWGAQGGNSGGKGGYSTGYINLEGTETLYFYVGGSGGLGKGGFNGGGSAGSKGGGGGGATDIRINNDDLNARVIVAGGGGGKGQDSCAAGGAGGGTNGVGGLSQSSCGTQGGGGTQSSGGAVGIYSSTNGLNAGGFGIGGSAADANYDGGGGGGGWYGGGAGASAGWSNGGGGGSGFVYTTWVSSEYLLPYSYYSLESGTTFDGTQSTIPTISGTGTETGHSGNGYIKITRMY